MEKRRAHYDLKSIKLAVSQLGIDAFTRTARLGAADMGLLEDEALSVIGGIESGMFYKSMTTYANSTRWQDVYHVPCPNGKTAYIKFTRQEGELVIQFKEK